MLPKPSTTHRIRRSGAKRLRGPRVPGFSVGRVVAFGCGEDEEGVPQTLPYKPERAQRVGSQGVFSARGTLRISLSSSWSPEPRARVSRKGCAKPPRAAKVPASAPPCAPAPVAICTTPRSPACARCPEFPRRHSLVHSRLPRRQEMLLHPHHRRICHADARAPRAASRRRGRRRAAVRALPAVLARGVGARCVGECTGTPASGSSEMRGAGGGGRSGARGALIAQGHGRGGEPGKRALA